VTFIVGLNAGRLEKSTISFGRLFQILTTRWAKNADLSVQLQHGVSIRMSTGDICNSEVEKSDGLSLSG